MSECVWCVFSLLHDVLFVFALFSFSLNFQVSCAFRVRFVCVSFAFLVELNRGLGRRGMERQLALLHCLQEPHKNERERACADCSSLIGAGGDPLPFSMTGGSDGEEWSSNSLSSIVSPELDPREGWGKSSLSSGTGSLISIPCEKEDELRNNTFSSAVFRRSSREKSGG